MRTPNRPTRNGSANSERPSKGGRSRSKHPARSPGGPLRSQPRIRLLAPPKDELRRFYEVIKGGSGMGSLVDKKLRLTRRILFLGRRWRNLMDEALRASGDNHARWVTLLWVDMMAGRANLGELAEQIAVELPTLVRLLNRLEREQLLVRRALDGSNREKTVVLTAKGKSALVHMSEVIDRTQARFLDDVDERQLDTALKVLDGVLEKYAQIVMWPGKMG